MQSILIRFSCSNSDVYHVRKILTFAVPRAHFALTKFYCTSPVSRGRWRWGEENASLRFLGIGKEGKPRCTGDDKGLNNPCGSRVPAGVKDAGLLVSFDSRRPAGHPDRKYAEDDRLMDRSIRPMKGATVRKVHVRRLPRTMTNPRGWTIESRFFFSVPSHGPAGGGGGCGAVQVRVRRSDEKAKLLLKRVLCQGMINDAATAGTLKRQKSWLMSHRHQSQLPWHLLLFFCYFICYDVIVIFYSRDWCIFEPLIFPHLPYFIA